MLPRETCTRMSALLCPYASRPPTRADWKFWQRVALAEAERRGCHEDAFYIAAYAMALFMSSDDYHELTALRLALDHVAGDRGQPPPTDGIARGPW
jgi:hypothetical protein